MLSILKNKISKVVTIKAMTLLFQYCIETVLGFYQTSHVFHQNSFIEEWVQVVVHVIYVI